MLTGTNDYPLLSEAAVEVLDVKPVAPASYPVNIQYAPLPAIRLAEPFEKLRDASDRALAKTGERPKIFLANLGTPAEFNARAAFAKNFFEAGGIEAVTNDGFAPSGMPSPSPLPMGEVGTDIAALVSAYKKSGAALACLCSSDAMYERETISAAKALAAAGATHVYLAGRPKNADALKVAGIGSFIFAGCDALATLQATHRLLSL